MLSLLGIASAYDKRDCVLEFTILAVPDEATDKRLREPAPLPDSELAAILVEAVRKTLAKLESGDFFSVVTQEVPPVGKPRSDPRNN